MNLLLLLFLAAVTIHSPSLSEAQDLDGVRLLRACGAAVKQQDGMNVSDQDMLESLWCIGYVQGFLDSISITQSVTGSRQGVCLPPQGVANDQAVRILVKYLRDNPQSLHESGRSSLYIALAKAFPCR
jgi:Rap1a immunity proteins